MADMLDEAVQDYITSAKSRTVAGFATTPDDAARAVQLEDATGTPAPLISPDVQSYDKTTQRDMASTMVERDPQLMAYVHSHPMAASVSQNDWGNLSILSQAAQAHAGILKTLNAPWDRGFDAALDAAKEDFNRPITQYSYEDIAKSFPAMGPGKGPLGFTANLLTATGLNIGSIIGEGTSNIASGLIHGASAFVSQFAKSVGMSDTAADSLTREVGAILEQKTIEPGAAMEAVHGDTTEHLNAMLQASQVSRSFINTLKTFGDAGKEAPKGVVPAIDALRGAANAQLLEHLDEVVKQAQSSDTKELASGLFRNFMEQHYGQSTLGISSDAAMALYGDKLPEPNDGLLGWVPGIADKLEVARQTGSDVDIPIADWVAHVDPAIAKNLHDDLRIWPGGVTAREGLELGEAEPKLMIEDTLPQVRGSYGMEPMFSMGDRKLTLRSDADRFGHELPKYGQTEEMHGIGIYDENSRMVGYITLTPQGKNLNIEEISGTAGRWANHFGPALIMDLKRQLKAMYPEAETISGYRVTGARKEAGSGPATTSVKLDAKGLDQVEATRDLLSETYARKLSENVSVDIVPSHLYEANEKAMAGIVHEELARITGKKAKVVPSAGIDYKGVGQPRGLYIPKAGLIVYDLLGEDPIGTGRHEAIHFLKDQGLFSDKEWNTLTEAAEQEGWKERYNIGDRYAKFSPEVHTEEAIAEAFREWAKAKDGERREHSPVAQIFQKIMDLLDKIRGRFKELFGREPSADELFQKVSSGEIGERASMGTGGGGPLFSMDELENLKASGLGLDSKTFANLTKLVNERYERDLAKAQEKAERDQKKRQSAEWKENREAMKQDVEASIRQRPDIAVDQFLGTGQLNGKQMPQKRYSLLESDLTAEQKKLLPSTYYSKSGFPVDEVAKQFGYPSGEAMIQHLGSYNSAKAGRSTREMFEHTVNVETDRQMEAKYGDLPSNILSEAKAQAFSDSEVHLVTEEYQAAAQMAGVTAVDRAVIAQSARDSVNKMAFEGIKSDKFAELVKKAQDIAVRALANGDPALAVQALQRRTENAHIVKEIQAIEKQIPKFQRLTKFYAKPWDVTKPSPVDAEWSLFTRNMLSKVGLPSGMSIQGMAQRIASKRFADLADFVTKMENENEVAGLQLPVPDWLLKNDPQQKPFKNLTVQEWKDLNQSLVTFDKLGRDEQKAVTADAKVDKAELVGKMKRQLADYFEPITKDLAGKGEWSQALGHFIAASTSNETLMSRFDHRDTHGLFTETFSKPAASAANHAAVLERETGKALRELGPVKDGERTLTSPFIDPRSKEPIKNFTRNNLAVVISNLGNEYNWRTLTKGWRIDPDQLMKWVEAHSTIEDLERAQSMGKIWKGLWEQSSAMYERLYGVAPEAVEPRPFMMHGKQWDGWYHPIIGDTDLSRYVNKLPELDKAETNFWPATNNAYTKRRTGAIQVLDLSYDQIGVRLSQEIHDIAFREFVSNTAKLMKDQTFRQAVTAHYGKEYLDQMDGWLQRTAGKNSFNGAAMRLAQRWSNELRQNVISTYVAFNPITAAKHGSTAWMMSSRELDANLFKSVPKFLGFTAELKMNQWFGTAVSDLYGKSPQMGDKLWDWSVGESEELKRRERNYQDTIGGAMGLNAGERRWRDKVSQVGASVVAWSDLQSAVPLWLATYRKEFARSAEHGTAVREGDLAVRRAHGSTAITNLPAIATSQDILGPWMTSLYGFMGTNMQRRIEMFHDLNDAYKLSMSGHINEASKKLPTILSSLATYVIWTGIVEEVASQQFFSDHRSLGEKTLGWLFGTAAQTVIGVRDLVYDVATGKEDAGLISTPMHDMSNLLRDAKKNDPLGKAHIGKFVADGCATIGDLKGLCPRHVGKAAQYGIDMFNGYQIPHSIGDIEKGLVTGTQKSKIVR
jgi:hypothetical protein